MIHSQHYKTTFAIALTIGCMLFASLAGTGLGQGPVKMSHDSLLNAEATAPTYQNGDFWIYRIKQHNLGYSTTNVLDGDYHITMTKGGRRFLRLDDQQVLNINQAGALFIMQPTGPVQKRATQYFKFPLFVGKKWDARFTVGGKERKAYNQVTGFEQVHTLAGTFDAYKIVRELERVTGWDETSRQFFTYVYFYSPNAGATVKYRYEWHMATDNGHPVPQHITEIELLQYGKPDPILLRASNQAADLDFPQPSNAESVQSPRMAVLKPDGEGPFPGLVLIHQCAGLGIGRSPNLSMLGWAREAVSRGYAVLLLDSLSPRGVDTLCFGPKNGVNLPRGVKDAFQAADHLRKLPFVDPKRIVLGGYSWGAMVGALASSKRWGASLAPTNRFLATVSFYPGCRTIVPQSETPYEVVDFDIDRPLLVLIGKSDNEAPAAECLEKLKTAKTAGAPVEWYVYPETTHCWDCRQLDNLFKIDARGNPVTYRYSEKITRDSTQRMFDFFNRHLR